MMNPIDRILQNFPIVILDGALATELERRGCDLRDALWSARVLLEAPHQIKQVHADYFAAGADCATTATYQATYAGFAHRGLSHQQATDLFHLAVDLAADARDEFWSVPQHRQGRPRPLVAASIGSYGAFLADGSEYHGDYGLSEQELMDFHRPRMSTLAETGADLLACETIPSLHEARALVRLLEEFPDTCAWISFSARDGAHTCAGERLSDCAAYLDHHDQIVAIGVNCTAPHFISDLVREMGSATHKPIAVYPNSGEVFRSSEVGWVGRGEMETYGKQAETWHSLGASLIGGCCRTTPVQIREIATWRRNPHPS